MNSFLSLLGTLFSNLYGMLIDSKISSLIGVNLFWALFGFFCLWTVLNIFVFRSSISPGVISSVISKGSSDRSKEGD